MSYELESSYFLPRKSTTICVATSTAGFDTDVSELSSTAAGVHRPIQSPTDHHECPVCSKSFSSTSTLNRHWRDFHTDRSKEAASDPCASFDDDSTKILRYDALGHLLSACDSATTTNSCNVSTSGQLVGVGRHQSGSQSNRQCSICSKMFSSTSCMNRHRRDFHGDRSRGKVTDSSSPTTANGSSSLSGFCDRQCNVCLKMFSSSSTLNRHRREIHGDHSDKKKMEQLEKSFRCSECHRSLSSRASFVRHLAANHPQINLEKQELVFRSDVEFDAWKFKMETDGESKFVRSDDASRIIKTINKDSDTGGADLINYYNCQYSICGRYYPHNYKRRKLFHGSPDSESGSGSGSGSESKNASKLDFFCPAHIITRTNRICNSPVSVSFLPTHLGHHQRFVQMSEKGHLRRPKSMNDCLEVDRHDLVKPEPLKFRDEFKARKERLFDELNGLFLVIDECTTQNEFDAFDGLLKLVRPVLTTIRTSTSSSSSPSYDFADGLPQFSKQVLDTLSPFIGLARPTTSMDVKEENERQRPVVAGQDDADVAKAAVHESRRDTSAS